jgi:hypothetical protein
MNQIFLAVGPLYALKERVEHSPEAARYDSLEEAQVAIASHRIFSASYAMEISVTGTQVQCVEAETEIIANFYIFELGTDKVSSSHIVALRYAYEELSTNPLLPVGARDFREAAVISRALVAAKGGEIGQVPIRYCWYQPVTDGEGRAMQVMIIDLTAILPGGQRSKK